MSSSPNHVPSLSESRIFWGFIFFNAVFRLALLRINGGEYTVGILQIIQFSQPNSFWPPLYTAGVWILTHLGIEPIYAGRLISWACSIAIIAPLWKLARAWAGPRAAIFTLALYTVSPEALRWSERVMTDMPFVFLLHMACLGLLQFWSRDLQPKSAKSLIWITLVAVLATLTRYQGILLVPLVLLTAAQALRRGLPGRWAALAAQILWLSLPLWLAFQHFGHLQQVMERQSPGGWAQTLLNYWDVGEMFIYITPYMLTLPVFCFFIYGFVREPMEAGKLSNPWPDSQIRRSMPIRALFLYIALLVLVAQSAFQSFQTRYLLPLVPLTLTFAGVGMARMEATISGRKRGESLIQCAAAITIIWSLAFSMASLFLQREAWQDIFEAGHYIRALNLPASVQVYSNESYKPELNGIKLAFAAQRTVEMIPDFLGKPNPMPPGSIIALHSAYGGLAAQNAFYRLLTQPESRAGLSNANPYLRLIERYDLELIDNAVFESSLVPLLPDIMQEPGSHQNPLAWAMRYQRQDFRTLLFRVKAAR
jgi:hypothetical protein